VPPADHGFELGSRAEAERLSRCLVVESQPTSGQHVEGGVVESGDHATESCGGGDEQTSLVSDHLQVVSKMAILGTRALSLGRLTLYQTDEGQTRGQGEGRNKCGLLLA
jgi:hypothetical protein